MRGLHRPGAPRSSSGCIRICAISIDSPPRICRRFSTSAILMEGSVRCWLTQSVLTRTFVPFCAVISASCSRKRPAILRRSQASCKPARILEMATRLTTILVIVIVGATFIAGLIVGAQRDDANGPVDLIIVNGKVYPGGGANIQEAVAVRGNQILRVGSNRTVKRLRRAQ